MVNDIEKFKILTFMSSREGTLLYEYVEDLIEALRELGQEVFVLDLYSKREEIRNTRDLIITCFGLVPKLFDRLKIPYAAWLTNDPMTSGIPPPSQYFHLFIHENGAIKEVRKMGYKNLYYLPLAVNPRRYRKIPQEDKVLDKYRCEVSFLGNAGPRWEENGYGRHEHLGGFLSQEKIREMLWLESTMPVR